MHWTAAMYWVKARWKFSIKPSAWLCFERKSSKVILLVWLLSDAQNQQTCKSLLLQRMFTWICNLHILATLSTLAVSEMLSSTSGHCRDVQSIADTHTCKHDWTRRKILVMWLYNYTLIHFFKINHTTLLHCNALSILWSRVEQSIISSVESYMRT